MMETGTFGQAKATVSEQELVAVHVGHLFEEGTVQVDAFKVPVICKALQNQHVEEAKRVHPYLNKLGRRIWKLICSLVPISCGSS